MIAKVRLEGFKGVHQELDLIGPTLISGPNGSGKSAVIEGVIYAVSGRTPAGKTLDSVADCFADGIGTVTVWDSEQHWIRRGVGYDAKKKKRSEILETSEDGATARWETTAELLRLEEIRSMSSDKRRALILRLAGAPGEGTQPDLLEILETHFARKLAGPAAASETLAVIAEDTTDQYPSELIEIARDWLGLDRRVAVRELLAERIRADKSQSETIGVLREVVRDGACTARGESREADAALAELESVLQSKRATEQDVATARKNAARAAQESEAAARKYAEISGLHGELKETNERLHDAHEALRVAEQYLDENPIPTEPTQPPDSDEYVAAKVRHGEIEAELAQATLRDALVAWFDRRLVRRLIDEDETIPRIGDRMLLDWRADAVGVLRDLRTILEAGSETKDLWEQLNASTARLAAFRTAAEESWAETLDGYRAALERRDQAERCVLAARTAVATTEARHKVIVEKLAGKPDLEAYYNVSRSARKAAEDARTALGEAERAAGAIDAYDRARARARALTVRQKTWALVLPALEELREVAVRDSVEPVRAEITRLLQAASGGADVEAYVELINSRDKPDCQLGVQRRGPNNHIVRVPWEALSAGESAVFSGALAAALLRRAPGLHILAIEADPIDELALPLFLETLGREWERQSFDALLVVTAAREPEAGTGWAVVSYW